jgi:hypothetical protein
MVPVDGGGWRCPEAARGTALKRKVYGSTYGIPSFVFLFLSWKHGADVFFLLRPRAARPAFGRPAPTRCPPHRAAPPPASPYSKNKKTRAIFSWW